jgi:predicted hotdog family 3-hydroxylacyl-ACP dehydratase
MANLPLNRQDVEKCLPHKAAMVLLEKVRHCNSDTLECETTTHLQEDHPLRIEGQLSIFTGIEYAAQAMALHSFLNADYEGKAKTGFVAVTSRVKPYFDFLDQVQDTLNISVALVDASGGGSLYEFCISYGADKAAVLDGKLLVMLSD